jgi:AraC family transcriptional regulator
MLNATAEKRGSNVRTTEGKTYFRVETETQWRCNDSLSACPEHRAVIVSRWHDATEGERFLTAPTLERHYTIEILLAETRVDCFKNGSQISAHAGGFGATQIAAPGEQIRCRFSRKMSAVHLFVPVQTVVSAYVDVRQRDCPEGFQLADPAFRADYKLGRLAAFFTELDADGGPFGGMYLEALTTAILARLLDTHATHSGVKSVSTGLQPWLLHRVIDFMEANLHTSLTLQEIATQTGLSRMHFAAQFRRSTGCSPHAFLLKRRLEKAKEMLVTDAIPLRDVALAVGFQSQAHFTTIFRKLMGTTPGRWRASNLSDLATPADVGRTR